MSGDTKILIIDDDPFLRRLLDTSLQQAGYVVFEAENGREGVRRFFENKPDLVLLDINMPDMDGWTTCERIREISDVPIIMLTVQAQRKDVIKGLDLGADNYMVKPFITEELLARIRSNLRRVSVGQPAIKKDIVYSDETLSISLDERRVVREGVPLKLTKIEFDLLAELVRTAPRIATYRALLTNVWGPEYSKDIDYLRVYVWHLRRKIEPDPQNPIYIINEHGLGYRFERR